jgi:hypothetical protein
MQQTMVEFFEMKAKYGTPIFEKLFNYNRETLQYVLVKLFQRKGVNQHLLDMVQLSDVHKTTRNDTPDKIKLWFHSHIEITNTSIYYTPEHGSAILLLDFYQDNIKLEDI